MAQVCHWQALTSIRLMGDSIYRKVMIRFNLQQFYDASLANRVPGQTLHQRVKLLIGNRHLRCAPGLSPVELSPIKAPGTQPNPKPVVDQHFHPIRALVREQIRTMRSGTAKHLNNSGQRCIRPGAHIQWRSRQPDLVDADHCNSSRNSARH